jgi:hypothetical protein
MNTTKTKRKEDDDDDDDTDRIIEKLHELDLQRQAAEILYKLDKIDKEQYKEELYRTAACYNIVERFRALTKKEVMEG